MRLLTVLILVSVLAALTFYFFISIGEVNLGVIMSVIMFCWPIGLWEVLRVSAGKPPLQVADEKPIEAPQETEKVKVEMPQIDVTAMKDNLAKLRSVAKTIEDEKRQGIISDKTYDDLISQNNASIERIEKELN